MGLMKCALRQSVLNIELFAIPVCCTKKGYYFLDPDLCCCGVCSFDSLRQLYSIIVGFFFSWRSSTEL